MRKGFSTLLCINELQMTNIRLVLTHCFINFAVQLSDEGYEFAGLEPRIGLLSTGLDHWSADYWISGLTFDTRNLGNRAHNYY